MKNSKKVLIFYGSFGGGHLSAAKAIEAELHKQGNIETKSVDSLKYINKGFNKISTSLYFGIIKKSPWFWGKLYFDSQKGPLSKVLYSSNSLMSSKLNKLIHSFKPDEIICTHPFPAQTCVYLKEHGKLDVKISVIMTDYEIHSQWYSRHQFLNHIFVGSNKMKDDLILKNVKPNKIHVTGIPVKEEFSKNYDKKEIFKSLDFDENKKTFLFFGGGEMGIGKNLPILTLNKALQTFTDSQFIVISGKNNKLYNNFKNVIKTNNVENRAKLFKFTDKVPEYMHVATAVFSKPGGITTSEALVSELPFIIFDPLPGQEYANTSFVLENEVGTFISTENRIEDILNNLKDNPSSFDKMIANIKKIKKPNAAEDICKIVLKDLT